MRTQFEFPLECVGAVFVLFVEVEAESGFQREALRHTPRDRDAAHSLVDQ